jgi:hypothetical protein
MPFNTSTTRKNTSPPDAEKRQVCNMPRWLRDEVQAALSAASRCIWHRPKKMPSLVPPKRETSVGHKSAQEGVPSSATKVPATGPLGGHSSAHTASVLIDWLPLCTKVMKQMKLHDNQNQKRLCHDEPNYRFDACMSEQRAQKAQHKSVMREPWPCSACQLSPHGQKCLLAPTGASCAASWRANWRATQKKTLALDKGPGWAGKSTQTHEMQSPQL